MKESHYPRLGLTVLRNWFNKNAQHLVNTLKTKTFNFDLIRFNFDSQFKYQNICLEHGVLYNFENVEQVTEVN